MLLLLTVFFFLDFLLYRNRKADKLYMLFAWGVSVVGVCGMAGTRFLLQANLHKTLQAFSEHDIFDKSNAAWITARFDLFAVVSAIAVVLFIVCMLVVLRRGGEAYNYGVIVVAAMVLLFAVAVWYCLGSVSKLFDVASYISAFACFEVLVMHVLLAAERRRSAVIK